MSERTNRGLPADACVAVAKRRLGTLPFSLAIGCCDIGEATMRDGSKVLTTWGLNLPVEEQEWFIKETRFHPIWIGADDGACELILGESGSCDPWVAWIREGLKIGENPAWEEVSDE